MNGAGAHLEYREEKPRAFGACVGAIRGLRATQIISGTGKYYFVSKLCKYYFEHVFMRLPASQATDAALE